MARILILCDLLFELVVLNGHTIMSTGANNAKFTGLKRVPVMFGRW